LELKIPDVVVQDRCPETLLANDGPTVVNLIVIRLEVVVAKAMWVQDVEKMALEAVPVVVVEAVWVQAQSVEEIVMEDSEMVMEAVKALPEPKG